MADNKDNGGQAFPRMWPNSAPDHGMTLREYFAGQALTGYIAHYGVTLGRQDDGAVARRCLDIAGAMLAERSK